LSDGTPSDPDARATPLPGDRRRGQLLALAALLVYAALACWELRAVLHPDAVLSPAAFVAHSGPFSEDFRARAPEGVDLLADTARQFTPWLRYAAEHLAHDGALPLWKTTSFCGAPLVGNGQSALFFPPRLLALLLGAPGWMHAAMDWLRLVVAAFGGYLLLRHLRASAAAAFVGGLVFGFGGFLIVYRFHPHADVVALLPWLVLAADRLALQPGARRIALVALLAGLQWLAGHPQTALHAQGCVALLVLARAWSRRREPDSPGVLGPLLALGAALLLGLGLAALQLGPLLEYAALSESAITREAARSFPFLDQPLLSTAFVTALTVAGLALAWLARGRRVLLPALLLLVATASALLAGLRCGLTEAFVLPFCADWFGPPTNYMGPLNYVATNSAYTGAALPLCAVGLLFGRPRGVVRAAGACAVFGVLAGLYAPVLMDLLRALPVVGLADNGRLVLIGMLGLAVLAGLGVDGLRHAASRPAARARLAAALLAPALAVLGVLVWSVRTGDIQSEDAPGTRRAPAKLQHVGLLEPALESRVREIEAADAIALKLEDPPSGPDDLTLLGWFLVSEPVLGMQLIYGTQAAVAPTRWARVPGDVPLQGLAAGQVGPVPPGSIVYVFRASFPRDALPPQFPAVELHVVTAAGLMKSKLLRAHEPTRDAALLFPARPAPPPADGQRQLILLGLATLLTLVACGTGAPMLQAIVAAALLALVAASLLPFGTALAPGLPRAFFYPRSGGFVTPERTWPDQRVLCMDIYALGAEVPTAYGIPDVRGYDALTPPRIALLLRAALDVPGRHTSMEELPARLDPDLSLLGLMAVSLVLDWDGAPRNLRHIPWDGHPLLVQRFPLIENPLALRRARLVSRATLQPNDARALTLLLDERFDRADAAVLGDAEGVPEALLVPEQDVLSETVGEPADPAPVGPVAAHLAAAGSAVIAFDEPDFVLVQIEPTAPALLLLADTDFPGWRAYVDGVERPVLRANVAFRAVPVAPGERSVEFRYEPRSFAIGQLVSGASLLAMTALLVARRRPAGAPGAEARE
jgi:hypothetical protein